MRAVDLVTGRVIVHNHRADDIVATTRVGLGVYGRAGTPFALTRGEVRGQRQCQLSGCSSLQLNVLWPGGKRTWCCTRGMIWNGLYWRLE